MPPSFMKLAAATKLDSSEARKTNIGAISSGSARRPSGVNYISILASASVTVRDIGVST